jgi:hypothetical protein
MSTSLKWSLPSSLKPNTFVTYVFQMVYMKNIIIYTKTRNMVGYERFKTMYYVINKNLFL